MKYQNIHLKQFLFGLFLLLSYQIQAQFILEAPKTSIENGSVSNYRWYVYSIDEAGVVNTPVLLKEDPTDNTFEVKIPGVYFAKYEGAIYGQNASNYFIVTYCDEPDNQVILDITSSVSSTASVSWNNGLYTDDLSLMVTATKDTLKYTASVNKAGSMQQLPSFTVVCLYKKFELVDDIVKEIQIEGTEISMLKNDKAIPSIGIIEISEAKYGSIIHNNKDANPSDDTITYIPGSNFKGQDEFTYTMSVLNTDGTTMTDTATITINALYAEDDNLIVLEDSKASASNQIDVTKNDNIGETGSSLNAYQYNEEASNGTVIEVSDGVFEYIPNPNFNGNDRFSYTLTDENGNQATAIVRVMVTPVKENPVAIDDYYLLDGKSLIMDILENDIDIDGDTLSIYDYGLPEHGFVELNPNDNTILIYTPEPGFVGEDSFTYTVTDGKEGYDDATVHVDVSNRNNDKDEIAQNDAVATDEDIPFTIDILENDDIEKISNFSIQANNPIYGTVNINIDNTITYTPESDFVGNDTFEYSINYINVDGTTESSSAIVTIKVNATIDIAADFYEIDSSNPSEVIFNVLRNDTFNVDSNLILSSIGTPTNGVATIGTDNTISYVADASYEGQDVFDYVVNVIHSDGSSNYESGLITVNAKSLDPIQPLVPEEELQVHQLVTPNGDGRNDVFRIRGIENYPQNSVKIFNRWGVLVFETERYGQNTNYFEGYSQGRITIGQNSKLPVGTYYYAIEYVKDQTIKSTAGYLYINY